LGKYNVALRYTKKAGGYHGIITWTNFPDKECFDKWYTDSIREMQEIVEEGISASRCIELVETTPMACRMAAALQEATDSEGNVNEALLKMNISTALLVEMLR